MDADLEKELRGFLEERREKKAMREGARWAALHILTAIGLVAVVVFIVIAARIAMTH